MGRVAAPADRSRRDALADKEGDSMPHITLRGSLAHAGLLPLLALALALGGCATQAQSAASTSTATLTPAPMPTATPHDATSAPSAPAVIGPTCRPDQLTLAIKFLGAATGNVGEMAHFTNHSTVACSLYGFPGAQLLNAQRDPMITHTHWQTSAYLYTTQPVSHVQMAPGAAAYFVVEWEDVPSGSATSCPLASYLEVTPPNDYSAITIANTVGACGGNLYISPVEPTQFTGG